ncbi:hypothetical protein M1V08_001591 [Campylobacter jejuni]|nr:hypothetical protein [Campylobacter jejuni]
MVIKFQDRGVNYSLPESALNKSVAVRGNVWTKQNMSNKTSANTIHLVLNNDYNITYKLHPISRYYKKDAKIPVDKIMHNYKNPIKLATWQSGSAKAVRGWDPAGSLIMAGELEFYWN